jgi:group I intron endonuclease
MMGTGFLGYESSPKWSKFKKSKIFNLCTKLVKKQCVNLFQLLILNPEACAALDLRSSACAALDLRSSEAQRPLFFLIQISLSHKRRVEVSPPYVRTSNNNFKFKPSLGIRNYSTSSIKVPSPSTSPSTLNSKACASLDRRSSAAQALERRSSAEELGLNKIVTATNLTDFLIGKNLNPVYCYEDLHLDSTRTKIQRETSNLSGIYLILNKETLDYYIGSASTNRFYARFSNHLLYFRGSKIVKLAVKTYKLSKFAFIILEIFPEVVNKYNNKQLLDLEDFYLKSLLPNYNILTEAGNSYGYKHTEVTRIKMRANYSEKRREMIGSLNRGKNLSKETIEKIKTKSFNRESPNYSGLALLNIKKKSKPIILYNLNNTVYGEFSSIVEASKSIFCSEKTIRRALNKKKKILKRRWIVKYL